MNVTRTKTCPACGRRFSYSIGKGRDRWFCQEKECHNARKREQFHARLKGYPRCGTKGCSSPADRVGAGLCDACYCRLRRSGTTARRMAKYRYTTGAGYVKLLARDHPLADSKGNVYEHRKVMYDALGAGQQACFWCDCSMEWGDAVVDHLNEDKQDNRAENLVVACNNCNRARGAMLPFIEGLRPGALGILLEAIKRHHNAKTATEDGGFGNE